MCDGVTPYSLGEVVPLGAGSVGFLRPCLVGLPRPDRWFLWGHQPPAPAAYCPNSLGSGSHLSTSQGCVGL